MTCKTADRLRPQHLWSVLVGMTAIYTYIVGTFFFGLFASWTPVAEPFRDFRDFVYMPAIGALLFGFISFLGLWLAIGIGFTTSKRRHRFFPRLTIQCIESAPFVLPCAIAATFISLSALASIIHEMDCTEWIGSAPKFWASETNVVLYMLVPTVVLSIALGIVGNKIRHRMSGKLKRVSSESCGQCGYTLIEETTRCSECGSERDDTGSSTRPASRSE